MQCTVDSSAELCETLASTLPSHIADRSSTALSLVIIDSIGAFFPLDRACANVPTSPKITPPPANVPLTTEAYLAGTNLAASAPLLARSLQHVHGELVRALQAVLRLPTVVFVTLKASTHLTAGGQLQHRPYLPFAWDVRLLASCMDVSASPVHAFDGAYGLRLSAVTERGLHIGPCTLLLVALADIYCWHAVAYVDGCAYLQSLVTKRIVLSTDKLQGVQRCVARWELPRTTEHLEWTADGRLSVLAPA